MSFDRLAEAYFKPRSVESWQNGRIYLFLGVDLYKKLLPAKGALKRRTNSDQTKEHILLEFERSTRNYEWRHILGLIGFVVILAIVNKPLTGTDIVILAVINLLVNIYPIFLQRLNRIRIVRILTQQGLSAPY